MHMLFLQQKKNFIKRTSYTTTVGIFCRTEKTRHAKTTLQQHGKIQMQAGWFSAFYFAKSMC